VGGARQGLAIDAGEGLRRASSVGDLIERHRRIVRSRRIDSLSPRLSAKHNRQLRDRCDWGLSRSSLARRTMRNLHGRDCSEETNQNN